jgi:hypothetical protein
VRATKSFVTRVKNANSFVRDPSGENEISKHKVMTTRNSSGKTQQICGQAVLKNQKVAADLPVEKRQLYPSIKKSPS